MAPTAYSLETLRHRLLEGVLLRLARRPNVADFILRGGMLMRQWFRPLPRPAEDLDLVGTFPFDAEDASRRFLPALADDSVQDGVAYGVDRVRVDGIWLDSGTPGIRVFVSGIADGVEAEFHVDVTFGTITPSAPVFGELVTLSGQVAKIWVCRPEAIFGQKMQALWHYGMLSWRPKDLNDLHLLLTRIEMDPQEARKTIEVLFGDLGATLDDARALFGSSSWWTMKLSTARWMDFVKSSRGQNVPRNLPDVIAEVSKRLEPILEAAP